MQQLRVTNGRTGKRQASAMAATLSSVLGMLPACHPISAPFGYERNDWNEHSSIRVGSG